MYNFLFNTVSEASTIILNARWRYQKHSTKFEGYIGKKIWIVWHLEMKNWRYLPSNNELSISHENFWDEKKYIEKLIKWASCVSYRYCIRLAILFWAFFFEYNGKIHHSFRLERNWWWGWAFRTSNCYNTTRIWIIPHVIKKKIFEKIQKIDSNMHCYVSKNIQNHPSNVGEYVGKKIEIMRHIEM